MRAESVGFVFKDVSTLKTCKDNLYKKLNITIIPQGKGEEIPDPALINPSDDDERRRAVVVFWSVIPVANDK
jgi:hypothetical protein